MIEAVDHLSLEYTTQLFKSGKKKKKKKSHHSLNDWLPDFQVFFWSQQTHTEMCALLLGDA